MFRNGVNEIGKPKAGLVLGKIYYQKLNLQVIRYVS